MSSVAIIAVLSLVLEREWFWWLLVLLDIGACCSFWLYFFSFGPSGRHYLQWKARRRMKGELKQGRF